MRAFSKAGCQEPSISPTPIRERSELRFRQARLAVPSWSQSGSRGWQHGNAEPFPDNTTYVYTGQMYFPDNTGTGISQFAMAEHFDEARRSRSTASGFNNGQWNVPNTTGVFLCPPAGTTLNSASVKVAAAGVEHSGQDGAFGIPR